MFLMMIVGSHKLSQQSAPEAQVFWRLQGREHSLLGSASTAAVASAILPGARVSTHESKK